MRIRPAGSVLTVAVFATGALLAVSQLYLTVPLLAEVTGGYGVGPGAAAWVGTAFGLAYAVGNLVFGTASDRFDPRLVMSAGLVASAAATAVAGASPTFGVLVAARAAQGFTAAAFPPVALAYVGEVLPARQRALGISAISSCFLLAGIVGQAYALAVGGALGWRWAFELLTPALLGCSAAVWLIRGPNTPRGGTSLGATFAAFGGLLRRPALLAGYVCATTLLLTFVAMYGALNAAVGERYQISGAGPLLLLRLAGLPGIAASAGAGWLINRAGPHRVGCGAFAVAAVGLVIEATAGPLWLLLVGSAVYVGGLAVAIPAAVATVAAASGTARGAGIAGYGFLIGVGSGLAPLLVAALAPAGFSTLVLLLAGALAVAASALAAVARTAGRAAPGTEPGDTESGSTELGSTELGDTERVDRAGAGARHPRSLNW